MAEKFGLRASLIMIVALGLGNFQAIAQTPASLPELSHKRLLNDLQVTVVSTPNMGESLTIGLLLRYGSTFDPAEKGGLAFLASRMFARAAVDRSAKDIQDELDYLGATIETRCDWDGVRVLLRGQSSKFERSLLVLYQIVGEALLNDEDFAQVKSAILSQIQKPEDPRLRIRTQFESELFRGTSYARPLQGTAATVQNISMGDVRLFYARYISPNAASLVVVGSAPADLVLQKATRIWGVWVRGEEVPFTFLPPRKPASRSVFLENDPGSLAAQFILGNLWPRREEQSYYTAMLAAGILQQRLTKALPTSLLTVGEEGRRMLGPFYIQGQAAADQAIGEIQKILDAVEAFKASAVTPEELEEAQKRWITEFNAGLASTDVICNLVLDAELYRLGTNYAASFPSIVRRNSPDTIKDAAKEWFFPGGVVIVVRGPSETLKAGLESLGSVKQVAP